MSSRPLRWEPPSARPFSRTEAIGAGLTPDQIRQRVRSGRWAAVRRGWYLADGGELTTAGRVHVALGRVGDGAVASHLSAVSLHGLPLLRAGGPSVWLTGNRGRAASYPGLVVSPAGVRPDEWVMVEGVPTTTLARTAVDVARRWPLADAVTVLDAVLRRGTSRDGLWAAVLRADHWPGALRARRAVRFADGRSESPLESLSRVRLHQQRLPAPDLQVEVRGASGRCYRTDFGWRGQRVAGEADGRAKYLDLSVVAAEKHRQGDLEEAGLIVVRWSWQEIDRMPALVARRLRAAGERGAALRASGLPAL